MTQWVQYNCGHVVSAEQFEALKRRALEEQEEQEEYQDMLLDHWANVPQMEREIKEKRTEERIYAWADLRKKVNMFARWRYPLGTRCLNTNPYTDLEYRWLLYISIATSIVDLWTVGRKVSDDRLRLNTEWLGYGHWGRENFVQWRHQVMNLIQAMDKTCQYGMGHRAMESVYFAKFSIRMLGNMYKVLPELDQMLWAGTPAAEVECQSELPFYLPFFVNCWRPDLNYYFICAVLQTDSYNHNDFEKFKKHIGYQTGPNAPTADMQALRREELPRSRVRPFYDPVLDSFVKDGPWN